MNCNHHFRLVNVIIVFVGIFTVQLLHAQTKPAAPVYPRTAGYMSFVHPIVTIDKDQTTFNFNGAYTIGFPCGINLLKRDHIGFSFELTPFIRTENGVSKMNNLLFHPGVMLRYPHGFTIITRMAFETSGRFGVTAVFNKVLIRTALINYFAAIALPVRFGNDKPATVGATLQLGVSF